MASILLVDDDKTLLSTVRRWLEHAGHAVEAAYDVPEAADRLGSATFDLVVLDWQMPSGSGVDLCKTYRDRGGRSLVLMLTAMDSVDQKMCGLDAGADDYLTKPFELPELSARVNALLRRSNIYSPDVVAVGDLRIDLSGACATYGGTEVKLSNHEFAVLAFLARHPDRVYSAEELLDHVWPSDSDATPATIRTHIKNLRRKLEEAGLSVDIIRNVHGAGYCFNPNL